MKKFNSPTTQFIIATALVAGIYLFSASQNFWMWTICLLALPAIIFLAGGQRTAPVLVFWLSMSWLQIVTIVLIADIDGVALSELPTRSVNTMDSLHLPTAVFYSLSALLVAAIGIRCGDFLGSRIFIPSKNNVAERPFNLKNLLIGYAASAFIGALGSRIAIAAPQIAQLLIALTLIKFAFIYLIAAIVIETRRGLWWLICIILFEIVSGTFSYFSQFKEVIYVFAIAVYASRRALSPRMWMFTAATVVGVLWMALVWTTIKGEFRREIITTKDFSEQADYLADKYTSLNLDLKTSAEALLSRIQYVSLFSRVIALGEQGFLSETDYYRGAIIHILTPRFLFPDKPVLNDSQKTHDLIGLRIAKNTSIGVGYIAEAYADFGFPGLLAPVLLIGIMLSGATRYFMTRNAPLTVREAVSVATLFLSFEFEANIDKNLGGFITQFLVMAILLKFGYPMIGGWLKIKARTRDAPSRRPSRRTIV